MKKLFMVLPLVFLLCFTFSCQQGEEVGEQPVVDVTADVEAINEIWNQYVLGANTDDLELWISLWDENGIRMAPDTPATFGKEQIRAQMEPLFGQFNFEITINNEEVQIAGDWAFSRGAYILSLTPKVGGETTTFEGKYLTILKRQADGSWKVARDCFNYNAPPTTDKE
jgi:uncharacterized protein (TIGR02246 family)